MKERPMNRDNACMGKDSIYEKWYISRGMTLQGEVVHMWGDDTCVGDNTSYGENDVIHIWQDSYESDF